MQPISLALALSLAAGLTLLPGSAEAHHRHHAFHGGCCVFVSPGHAFFAHDAFRHRHFIPHGFFHRGFGSTFVVIAPVPRPVWVPGFWSWNGSQWVWVPGHWAQTFPAP